MDFFRWEMDYNDRILCIEDGGKTITYGEAERFSEEMKTAAESRKLLFLLCENSVGALIFYLAALRNGLVPLLLNAGMDEEQLKHLEEIYRPDYMAMPVSQFLLMKKGEKNIGENIYQALDYCLIKKEERGKRELHKDLALLLTTSGSTGSPRLVRQSYRNITSNAASIAAYLNIGKRERPITTLPMSYTYGLSIINSHVLAGASILMTKRSIMEKEFWEFFRRGQATSFGGVPYTYEMLKKLRFFSMELPSLKTMTQAGGKLGKTLHQEFDRYARETGKKFIVMYGQTEATARMSYLPWEDSKNKYGSIGIAIPGGSFRLADEEGKEISEPEKPGELIYYGPNVTMGYAEKESDLAKGDERQGRLETGDMAVRDKDGFYYIVGRKKRFLKIFGNRINLDEAEGILKQNFPGTEFACAGEDDSLSVFAVCRNEEILRKILPCLEEKLHINRRAFRLIEADEIPKNEAGKVQYGKLTSAAKKNRQ